MKVNNQVVYYLKKMKLLLTMVTLLISNTAFPHKSLIYALVLPTSPPSHFVKSQVVERCSAEVYVSMLDGPVITLHPESTSKCAGTSAQLRVTATGQNLQYQWKKDGVDITGATQNLLTLIGLQPGHAGEYTCQISNPEGSVLSNPAILTILLKIEITTQPQTQTLQQGETAQFFLAATGAVETYQWFKGNTEIFDGGKVSGAQTSALTISNISQEDQGKYFCKLIGPCNQKFSDDAYLSIISSLDDPEDHDELWSPNPAKNNIRLKENAKMPLSLTILDINGKEYTTISAPCKYLDISGLKPGLYFIKTTFPHKRSIQKLMVVR